MCECLPNKIKLGPWSFYEISLDDMYIYSEFIKQTEYNANLWSSNFAYIFAISKTNKKKLLWKFVDDMLVTFVYSSKKTLYLYCLPFGKGGPQKVMNVLIKCLRYCYEWNDHDKSKTLIRMISESQLEFLRKSPYFERYFKLDIWQGIERHFNIKKLVALQGKEFENIRNKLNGFKRENPQAKICKYQKEDFEKLIVLQKQWKNSFGGKYDMIFDGAYYKELLKHYEELHQIVLVMKNGENIIGMISGAPLPTRQAWGSIVKFQNGYRGLSETLIIEMAKALHSHNKDIEFLNTGSDLGAGGLRNFKLKFRPTINQKRYQVYIK